MREKGHLRFRTKTFSSIFKLDTQLVSLSINFHEKIFIIYTLILTTSDAEGAGEMFRATTLENKIETSKDFLLKTLFLQFLVSWKQNQAL